MSDDKRFDLGLDEDRDALWERVRELIRQAGEDPDEVIASAAANMERWRAARAAMSEDEKRADDREQLRAWAEHEATLDDMGNPLKPKP